MSERTRPYTSYAEFHQVGFAVDLGAINDECGQVLFAYKSQVKLIPKMPTDNKGIDQREGKTAILEVVRPEPKKTSCFYNHLADISDYNFKWMITEKSGKSILLRGLNKVPMKTIFIRKIELANQKRVLELRIKDPIDQIGLSPSPIDLFFSVAYSTAEKIKINDLIRDPANFIPGSKTFLIYDETIPGIRKVTAKERDYFEVTLLLKGSRKVQGKILSNTVKTGIIARSIDGRNFFTDAYAEAAFLKIEDKITWNNHIIPGAVSGDQPFGPDLNIIRKGLEDIISLAETLTPGSPDTAKDLLNQEIRDAFYSNNIDDLTFQMAFRFPFYMKNIAAQPYTNDNNPYYTKFDECYKIANSIRTASIKNISELNYAGKWKKDYAGGDFKDSDKDYYRLMGLQQHELFGSVTPAYMVKNFEYENARKKYNPRPHLPVKGGKVDKGSPRDLEELLQSNIITTIQKTALENGAKYVEIKGKGGFVVKEVDKKEFYLYDFSWPRNSGNESGITFGLGYDIGKRLEEKTPKKNLLAYISPDPETTKILNEFDVILVKAIGKIQEDAMRHFYPFFDMFWKHILMDYQKMVPATVKLMKNEYLEKSLNAIAIRYTTEKNLPLLLTIYQPFFKPFYNDNGDQFLNEIEKVVFLRASYNKGAGSLNPYHTKNPSLGESTRRFIHAFNTHDYRYLVYAVRKSKFANIPEVLNLMNTLDVFRYTNSTRAKIADIK
ncbi:hypothetical protein [Ferruginibacter sp. SUN106]|uniref:hypothetical protein n=1 Tax=Ferruginibacter sp. SUN106 TaxID=2978348 RepID=UPI003D36BA0F